MVAEFRGPPPHDPGTAELATVHALDEHIEVMLHLLSRADDARRGALLGGAFDAGSCASMR